MHAHRILPLAISLTLAAAGANAAGDTGPQSSQTPYISPTAPGWEVTALLAVGDTAKESPYAMVGIPDGMGAIAGKFAANGAYVADKAFMTVFLNHEIRPGLGVPRAHGQNGAFVSQWTVHLNSLQVKWGEDLVRRVYTWQGGTYADTTGATAFNRFCSGDLPPRAGFFNSATGKGYDGRIYMNGEESGNEGRAFAHVVTGEDKGVSYELPYLGKFSWENSVAQPGAGDKTIVVGLDDSTPGQLYVYVGDKRAVGNAVEKAGLQRGKLYGVKVTNGGANYGGGAVPLENGGAINGSFTLVDLSAHATGSGATLQAQSVASGVTEFARPEDGHWDPRNPNVFYWVTTGATLGGNAQSARLYRLTFDSLANPGGGTIELVLDSASLAGTDGATARSFDNLTVDAGGRVIVQEDPGNNPYIAKVWQVDPVARTAVQIFESDRARFLPGAAGFLTQDEENSGVIDVTDIVRNANWYEAGRRYYLGNMQAHYPIAGELVEGGQLYLMASPKAEAR
ncbi:MAG: alkaline phosphatase PhoX [Deltaproteobacteria bacterium]